MISDIVCEQLVAKKFDFIDLIKAVIIAIGTIGVSFIAAIVVYAVTQGVFAGASVLLIIGGIWLCIKWIKKLFIEYEYIFVNGELTVDKIFNKSSRRRIYSLDVKTVEKIGKYDAEKLKHKKYSSKLFYCATRNCENAYYMEFKHPTEGNTLMVFQPGEKLIKALKPYVDKLVYREAFGSM